MNKSIELRCSEKSLGDKFSKSGIFASNFIMLSVLDLGQWILSCCSLLLVNTGAIRTSSSSVTTLDKIEPTTSAYERPHPETMRLYLLKISR